MTQVNINLSLVDELKIHSRSDGEIKGYCPACNCDDAWFNTNKLAWRCWHCNTSGKIISKGGSKGNYVFKEVEEKILDIPKVRNLYSSLVNGYHDNMPEHATTYLKDRGIYQETIDKFKLGFCSTEYYEDYSDPLATESGILYNNSPALLGRVTIPYLVKGEATDIRGRSLVKKDNVPTYMSLSGSHKARGATYLFNYDIIEHSDEVIITEGEFKAVVGYQHGFPIVATPGIFGWQKEWSKLFKGKRVILAADFDRKFGQKSPAYLMAKSLISEIPQLKVAVLRVASYTTEGKIDVDSLLAGGHIGVFEKAVKGALDAKVWLKREGMYGV